MDMEIEWYGGWGRRDMNDRLIVIGWNRKKSCGGLGVKGWQARKEKLWDKYAVWIKVVMDEEKKKKQVEENFVRRNNDRRIVNFLRKWLELQRMELREDKNKNIRIINQRKLKKGKWKLCNFVKEELQKSTIEVY